MLTDKALQDARVEAQHPSDEGPTADETVAAEQELVEAPIENLRAIAGTEGFSAEEWDEREQPEVDFEASPNHSENEQSGKAESKEATEDPPSTSVEPLGQLGKAAKEIPNHRGWRIPRRQDSGSQRSQSVSPRRSGDGESHRQSHKKREFTSRGECARSVGALLENAHRQ